MFDTGCDNILEASKTDQRQRHIKLTRSHKMPESNTTRKREHSNHLNDFMHIVTIELKFRSKRGKKIDKIYVVAIRTAPVRGLQFTIRTGVHNFCRISTLLRIFADPKYCMSVAIE